MKIAVVGGGVSGLAAALRIIEQEPAAEVQLFESSDHLGGALRTERRDGYLIEHGADMFTVREPYAADLCERIGFSDQLIETNPRLRRAFLVHRGKLRPIPEGFTLMQPTRLRPFLASSLLSWPGKLRVGWEYLVPRRTATTDESLADFARRRLGSEAYERIVQPLIGGIYTADPEQLSMQAALPQFVEMERQHGGLIRAARGASRPTGRDAGARYGSFKAPREGMGAFVEALAERLPSGTVKLKTKVSTLRRSASGNGWQLALGDGSGWTDWDAVVLAVPAPVAARLLLAHQPELAGELDQIHYASAAVIAVGYRREQIRHPLDGFGCVTPLCEQRDVLSISFSSVKFAGRAEADRVLLRVFVGGACQAELLELSDNALREIAIRELEELLGAHGEPDFCRVIHWREAMPQYHLGHLDRVDLIRGRLQGLPRLALVGNAFHGVGIPFCVRQGEQGANELLSSLRNLNR